MFVRWFSMVLHSSFKVVSVWCYSFSMIFRCELSLRAALWVQTSLVSPTFPLDLWPAHTTAFWLLPSQWIRLRIIFAIANEDRVTVKKENLSNFSDSNVFSLASENRCTFCACVLPEIESAMHFIVAAFINFKYQMHFAAFLVDWPHKSGQVF